MKKSLLFLLLGLLFCSSCFVWAVHPQSQPFLQAIEKKVDEKWRYSAKEQLNYLTNIVAALGLPVFQSDQRLQPIIADLLLRAKEKKSALENIWPQEKLSEEISWISLPGVDAQWIRDAVLERHNQLREEKWLTPYTYHSELERTASHRASNLARIQKATHTRVVGDGYYNYAKIQQWFSDLGVSFFQLWGGATSFTESIAYRSYSCKEGDCTQALLTAAKKAFDQFKNEGVNGAHYKAIVAPHFKQIGIGFWVDEAKKVVYLVIHYGVGLVK